MSSVSKFSNHITNFKAAQEMQMQPQAQHPQKEQQYQNVQLPQIYNIQERVPAKNKALETLKKWDLFGMIHPWFEHPLIMLGSSAGLVWGVDKFSKACGGEYEKSLLGKATKFGDSLEKSKFVQSKPMQAIIGACKKGKEQVCKLFKNSDLFNAIRKTPSEGEWAFVKDEALNMNQRVIHELNTVVKTLKINEPGFVELTNLGIDKTEKEFLKKFFNNKNLAGIEEKASNAIQLKRLGFADDAIREAISKPEATEFVKSETLKVLGEPIEFFEKIEKNPATNRDIIKAREMCKRGKNIKIGVGHNKWLGPAQVIERTIGLDAIGNKIRSMTKDGAKTKTGRAFATFIQKCHRGFTFGGGKGGIILFVAPIVTETILNMKKAELDEKIGTGAHGLIHAASWAFTFPFALKVMHRFGGMQYAGMTPEEVAECRKLIKDFNEKANPFKEKCWYKNIFGIGERKAATETFQNYGEYKAELEQLKTK